MLVNAKLPCRLSTMMTIPLIISSVIGSQTCQRPSRFVNTFMGVALQEDDFYRDGIIKGKSCLCQCWCLESSCCNSVTATALGGGKYLCQFSNVTSTDSLHEKNKTNTYIRKSMIAFDSKSGSTCTDDSSYGESSGWGGTGSESGNGGGSGSGGTGTESGGNGGDTGGGGTGNESGSKDGNGGNVEGGVTGTGSGGDNGGGDTGNESGVNGSNSGGGGTGIGSGGNGANSGESEATTTNVGGNGVSGSEDGGTTANDDGSSGGGGTTTGVNGSGGGNGGTPTDTGNNGGGGGSGSGDATSEADGGTTGSSNGGTSADAGGNGGNTGSGVTTADASGTEAGSGSASTSDAGNGETTSGGGSTTEATLAEGECPPDLTITDGETCSWSTPNYNGIDHYPDSDYCSWLNITIPATYSTSSFMVNMLMDGPAKLTNPTQCAGDSITRYTADGIISKLCGDLSGQTWQEMATYSAPLKFSWKFCSDTSDGGTEIGFKMTITGIKL